MAIGNIIVGQSGGPTAVINASLVGIIQAARDLGAPQVYGMRYGIEGFLNGNIVDLYEQVPTEEDVYKRQHLSNVTS